VNETDDNAGPTIPWAAAPDQTIIYDTFGGGRELLRMPGLVPLPLGTIIQLGSAGDPDNPPQDGIVQAVRLWGAVPDGKPVLRLDVDTTLPA
jgi:hypothetical protein